MQTQTYEKDTSRGVRIHRNDVARSKRRAKKKGRWPELIARAYELDKGHVAGTKISPKIRLLKEQENHHARKHGEKSPFREALELVELAELRRKQLRMH